MLETSLSRGKALPTRLSEINVKSSQINGVLFEGGTELLSSLLNQGQLDYLFAYRAPKILGDPSAQPVFQGRQISTLDEAIQLIDIHHDSLGDDQLIRGHIHNP